MSDNHQTRMSLWKDYRFEINQNSMLQNAVAISNEKVKILHSRLEKVFPEINNLIHSDHETSLELETTELTSPKEFDVKELRLLKSAITKLEKHDVGMSFWTDDLEFGNNELSEVKSELMNDVKQTKYFAGLFRPERPDISQGITKKIKLGDPMRKIKIAIDGPSGSGKSTVSKMISKKLNITYINTGSVYRSIALYLLKHDMSLEDVGSIIRELPNINITLEAGELVTLNGVDVTNEIRKSYVTKATSKIAQFHEVRDFAVKLQSEYIRKDGVIMDGRDTTFRVMPDADLKIFLDSSPEVRADRRYKQDKSMGFQSDYNTILDNIKERDERDRTRENDPLHVSEGSIYIDGSQMRLNDVVEKILELVSAIDLSEKVDHE